MPNIKVFDGSHMTYRMLFTAARMNSLNMDNPDDHDSILNLSSYLFLTSLFSIIRSSNKSGYIFLFDSINSTEYRKSLNPNYKSNRKKNSIYLDLKKRIFKYLDLLKLNPLELPKYEADDIAYVISKNSQNDITLYSEDKDWKSFINDHCSLYRPVSKKLITWNDLIKDHSNLVSSITKNNEEWYKINNSSLDQLIHQLIIEKKALLGDASDNIKGFKGIGPKSADKLLISLHELDDYKNYKSTTKSTKQFQLEIDRFINNIKILGYSHIDHSEIIQGLDNDYSVNEDYKNQLVDITTEIKSKKLVNQIFKLNNELKNKVEKLSFNWS